MASNNNTPRSSSNNYSSFSSVPSSLAHFFSGSRLARGSSGSTSGSGQSGPGLASLAASPSAYPRSYADQVAEVGGALGGATIGHVQAGLQAALVGRPINRAVGPSGESVSMNATFLSETSRELGGAEEFLKKIGVRFDADGNIDQASLAAGLRDYMASEKVREDAFLSHWGDEEGKYFGDLGRYRVNGFGPGVLGNILRQEANIRLEGMAEAAGKSASRFRGVSFDEKGRNYRFLAAGYIPYLLNSKIQNLEARAEAGTATAKDVEDLKSLKQEAEEYTEDEKKDDWGERNGVISRIQKHLNFKYSEQGKLLKGFKGAKKIYGKFGKELKDYQDAPVWYIAKAPARIFWHKYLKGKVQQKVLEPMLKRAEDWFVKRGMGGLWKELKLLFRGGPSRVSYNAAVRGGETLGRYGAPAARRLATNVGKQAASGLKSALRAGGQAVWAAVKVLVSAVWDALVAAVSALAGAASGAIGAIGSLGGFVIALILLVVLFIVLLVVMAIVLLQTQTPSAGAGNCTITGAVAKMNSPKMLNFINDTAKKTCVPPSLVLAEMQREAPRAFSWSDADFDMFSGVGWQATPTGSLNKDKGYCYNNNAQAMGIMQFLQPTFDHYVPQIPNIDGHPSPDRCNAMDSIVAGELKIKADSGTSANNCNGWDQATVYKVAGNYCGDHCTGPCYDANPPRWCSQQCGTNYCGGVYQFYQGYQAGLVCTLGGGTGGNQKLVQAMLSLDPRAYSPPNIGGFSNDLFCLRMVGDALAKAGYPVSQQLRVGLAYQAFGAAPVPPDKEINSLAINGVQDFAPGDLVDWIGGSAGHIGMVISVDNNAKFVYVASNLDSTHYPTRVTPYVWDAAHHTLNVAGGQYGVISPGYTLLGIIRTP